MLLLIPLLALLLLVLGGTGSILYRWTKPFFRKPVWFALGYAGLLAAILVPFVFGRVPNSPVPHALIRFSHYALGVLLYTVLFAMLTALVQFVLHLATGKSWDRAALIFCTVLVVGLSACGIHNAETIRTVSYSITLDKPTAPIKIALVSDLHMGHIIDEAYLQKVADTINAMQPDVVCMAGDLIDGDMTAISDPEAIQRVFHSIQAPIYACLGNHDAGATWPQMLTFLSDCGIHVLLDESVTVDDRLLLVGRRDSSPIGAHEGTRTAVEISETTLPVVVLDHQPGNISQYADNVDLILCGHTHRGQLFPGNLVTSRIYDVDYGYYRASASAPQVIVTSGVGTWGPVLRVGSACEVVQITLN